MMELSHNNRSKRNQRGWSSVHKTTIQWCLLLSALCCQVQHVVGWDQDHMAMYDLVEEVNQNFYDVIGIPEDATTSQIRKAFRTLSMTEHPDKNNAPDANEKFRRIVAIVEILKSPDMRKEYDNVLKNGLPSWNSGVYYYRAAVKISVTQTLILIGVGSSLMHYVFMLTTYYETLSEWQTAMAKRSKRAKAESKENLDPKDYDIVFPRVLDIYSIKFVITLPSNIYWLLITRPQEQKLAKEEALAEAAEEAKCEEAEAKRQEEIRNRPAYVKPAPKFQELDETITAYVKDDIKPVEQTKKLVLKKGPWDDEELSKLVKLMNKYPGGSINRWERVAVELQRSEKECMKQANGIRSGLTRIKTSDITTKNNSVKQRRDTGQRINSVPTEGIKAVSVDENVFSQVQQNQLQDALRSVAKDASDRWDLIAACVEGKTKKQCVQRVRLLAKEAGQGK